MYRKIYFMGIKGVGMSTLAVIAKQAGFVVGGSDVEEQFITDKILKEAGIDVRIGFKKENVEDFFGTSPYEECLFIATAAHGGFDNPEAKFARSRNIKVISHGEAVGLFMSGELFGRSDIQGAARKGSALEGISVSGSHGKTTITAMIAVLLTKLGSDPSFTVGTSGIDPIGAAGHYSLGKYFVAEADEYLSEMKYDRIAKFLYQHPKYLIINNIDFDHPDFFRDIDEVKDAYSKLISQLDSDSILIVNGDDENIKRLKTEDLRLRTITYGAGDENEFVIKNFKQEGFQSRFEVLRNNTSLGNFELSVPGYHNAKNSLAAIALLMELGFSVSSIQKVMPEFQGSKRRLERIGQTRAGVEIFDDYAHHPEEIKKTLEALHAAFPDKKLTVVFQAHTFGRTKALMSEFMSAFIGVEELIILPTFASARDLGSEHIEEDRAFVEKIRAVQPNVKLIKTRAHVVEYIDKNIDSDSIVVTMGAGDVYKVASQLTNNL